MWRRPAFDPLPEPAAPNPADYTEMQTLAAELLPADAALDQAGLDLADVSAATYVGETAMNSLGLDLAVGAEELAAMEAEAAPDTLLDEVARAGEQDAALENAGLNVAETWPEW